METASGYSHSIYDLVTKFAVLLSQNENAELKTTYAKPTENQELASTHKRRLQIYHSLLQRNADQLAETDRQSCPSLIRLEQCQRLLRKQWDLYDCNLALQLEYFLFKLSTSAKQDEEQPSVQAKEKSRQKWLRHKNVLLDPLPFRLVEQSSNDHIQPPESRRESFFPTVNVVRSQLQQPPQEKCEKSNLFLRNFEELQNKFSSQPQPSNSFSFGDSLLRLNTKNKGFGERGPRQPLVEQNQEETAPLTQQKQQGNCDKFVAHLNLSLELRKRQDPNLELNVIELECFIGDAKKVAVGLQSRTFQCGKHGCFVIRSNTTIPDVMPEVLAAFASPFMECGDAYQRLSTLTQRPNRAKLSERPLRRALRQAIVDVLANSRQFMLLLVVQDLAQLRQNTATTIQLLVQLDAMMQHDLSLSNSSQDCLLGSLWSIVSACNNNEFLLLLMYMLKSLCHTYFGQLQQWLYQGELQGHWNELFVSFCPQQYINERSKEFFEKGYHINCEAVPGFLSGCEQAIVQCGRYNRLLKAYNAQHIVCSLQHPKLQICLTEQELLDMQQKLESYYVQLRKQVEPFSMASCLEQREELKRRHGNRMWHCTKAHIAEWQRRQQELQIEANALKQQRYEQLNQQLEQQQQIRMEQQRENIARELAFQKECADLEERQLRREKQALQVQINSVPPQSPDSSDSQSFVSCMDDVNMDFEVELTDMELNRQRNMSSQVQAANVTIRKKLLRSKSDLANSNEEESCSTTKVQLDSSFVTMRKKQQEPKLQRSKSDILNCNNDDSDMARNRMRNLASEQFLECQTLPLLQLEAASTSNQTEAQLNRLRVMNCTTLTAQLPPDHNMNLKPTSDMQRNRQRMLQHDQFVSFNSEESVHTERAKRLLQANNERGRNRRSCLRDEFNIDLALPLEPNKLQVQPDALTPMSTTSDLELERSVELNDSINNNNNSIVALAELPSVEPVLAVVKPNPCQRKAFFQFQCTPHCSGVTPAEMNPLSAMMVKRCMHLSVVLPLNAHLSLLRNEALRIFAELNVLDYLRQLRSFFFLMDGEFGTLMVNSLLQKIEAGMEPRSLCQRGVLDSILSLATSHCGDGTIVLLDHITLNCINIPEQFDLFGVQALSMFTLHCKLNWPLNLVISDEALAKYGQIFSHLLKLRHINFMLERAYLHLQELGKLHGRRLRAAPHYLHLQLVRHKLSQFVITLQNHLVTNALQASWQTFKTELRQVDSIETLYQIHVAYLKQIAFLALLNRQSVKLREAIDGILIIVLRFCKVLHSESFTLDDKENFIHPRYKRLVYEEGEFDKFLRYIIYLGKKASSTGYQKQIGDLIRIINFNNYYNVA